MGCCEIVLVLTPPDSPSIRVRILLVAARDLLAPYRSHAADGKLLASGDCAPTGFGHPRTAGPGVTLR
jgi:hypothetical protein